MDSSNLAGTQLGKYQLHAEIGRGGMGAVYKAYDPTLDRFVAIKVLAPHLVWEKEFIERFLREARAAARLRHPSIVTIYDVGQEGNWYYFAMEYLEGQTLAQFIRQRGPMSAEEALHILRPLAEGLDYAHRQGLVHRDVKPGNIIVGPGGHATLTDFGIARAAQETRLTRTGAIVGTPEYMSPEQAQGGGVSTGSDQYALGVVAYEMLAGRVPFQAESTAALLHKVVYEPPPPLRKTRPGLPVEVERVLERALAKEPVKRYRSCGEFVSALEKAALLPRTARPVTSTPPPKRTWLWLGVAGILLVVLCAVALGGTLALPALFGETPTVQPTAPSPPTTEPTSTHTAPSHPTPTATPPTPTAVPTIPTAMPPTDTPVPATETPSLADREDALLRTLRYREGNGDVIFAYQFQTPPMIDSRLDEWTGYVYEIAHEVHDPEGNRSGQSDLYGLFYTGWDVDNFYLGIEVTDDVHVQVQSGALLYEGDDVEIQIDADLSSDFHDSSLSSDDGQVGLSAGDFGSRGPEAYIWLPANREQPGTMIAVAARETGSGYTLEAAIPWWTLGGRPPVETAAGFCLSLGDNDLPGTAKQQTMISTAPARKWGDPTTWGTLILVDWR